MKHSPLPWSVRGQPKYTGFAVVDRNGRSDAAFPSTSKRPDEERQANANLIAAAGDMHAALLEMLAAHSMKNIGVEASTRRIKAKEAARAAIVKANQGGKP